jgi:hypothetical protein
MTRGGGAGDRCDDGGGGGGVTIGAFLTETDAAAASAKDLRTMMGTLLALAAGKGLGSC